MSLELLIVNLGVMSYADAWAIQQATLERRMNNKLPDTLLLVEHDPTISVGNNKKWNKLHKTREEIEARGINVQDSFRGGGAAYLGPGQLVGYTIMDIKPFGGVLKFLKAVEDAMIQVGKEFGVNVDRYDVMNPTTEKPYRATWVRSSNGDHVLATKGIGVVMRGKGLYTHHGFSLNVHTNETYFDLIDPCGFPINEVKPIALEACATRPVNMHDVRGIVGKKFAESLGYNHITNLHETAFLQYLGKKEEIKQGAQA